MNKDWNSSTSEVWPDPLIKEESIYVKGWDIKVDSRFCPHRNKWTGECFENRSLGVECAKSICPIKTITRPDPTEVYHLRCSKCGKSVSSPVPINTIVRAWLECPECTEAQKNSPE